EAPTLVRIHSTTFTHDGIVPSKPVLADPNDTCRCGLLLLREHLGDHDCVVVHPIDDAPSDPGVRDPEFVTAGPNAGHRPRVRHSEKLASLELSQQEAGFNPGVRRERRSLDLAPEPDPGACPSVTHGVIYVRTDMPA